VLLNLAEDPNVERKMKKRSIATFLCQLLSRDNVDLLVLVVTFLKKLSVDRDNLGEIVRFFTQLPVWSESVLGFTSSLSP